MARIPRQLIASNIGEIDKLVKCFLCVSAQKSTPVIEKRFIGNYVQFLLSR